jgi:hypothetical protein
MKVIKDFVTWGVTDLATILPRQDLATRADPQAVCESTKVTIDDLHLPSKRSMRCRSTTSLLPLPSPPSSRSSLAPPQMTTLTPMTMSRSSTIPTMPRMRCPSGSCRRRLVNPSHSQVYSTTCGKRALTSWTASSARRPVCLTAGLQGRPLVQCAVVRTSDPLLPPLVTIPIFTVRAHESHTATKALWPPPSAPVATEAPPPPQLPPPHATVRYHHHPQLPPSRPSRKSPKSGSHSCKSCNKTFNSAEPHDSHKAKHEA